MKEQNVTKWRFIKIWYILENYRPILSIWNQLVVLEEEMYLENTWIIILGGKVNVTSAESSCVSQDNYLKDNKFKLGLYILLYFQIILARPDIKNS